MVYHQLTLISVIILLRFKMKFRNENTIFQFGVKSARSLVNEFDKLVRLDLACVLDEAENYLHAAEVEWTLDNLIAAYNARLDLEY